MPESRRSCVIQGDHGNGSKNDEHVNIAVIKNVCFDIAKDHMSDQIPSQISQDHYRQRSFQGKSQQLVCGLTGISDLCLPGIGR